MWLSRSALGILKITANLNCWATCSSFKRVLLRGVSCLKLRVDSLAFSVLEKREVVRLQLSVVNPTAHLPVIPRPRCTVLHFHMTCTCFSPRCVKEQGCHLAYTILFVWNKKKVDFSWEHYVVHVWTVHDSTSAMHSLQNIKKKAWGMSWPAERLLSSQQWLFTFY